MKVIKSPFDLRVQLAQIIIFAIICIIVYHDLGTGETSIQNTNGLLFFISNLIGMASISGSILTFSMDRPVFLRETLNKSYTVSAFFIAKNICIGFIEVCGYFAGSSYGLLISVFVPKVEMAMALFPALVVPSMIFAGYLVNQSNIPYYFYEIEYISPFRYLFMANAINHYTDNKPDCDIACDPLAELDFDTGLWTSIYVLIGLGIGLRVLSLLGLRHISNLHKPRLN